MSDTGSNRPFGTPEGSPYGAPSNGGDASPYAEFASYDPQRESHGDGSSNPYGADASSGSLGDSASAGSPYGASGQSGFGDADPYAQGQGGQPYGLSGAHLAGQGQPGAGAVDPYAPAQPAYGSPSPYGAPDPYAYGQAPQQPAQGASNGLSIASIVCGIGSFLITPFLGIFALAGVAAIILGAIGLRREPGAKGLAITGIVAGSLAILGAIIVLVAWIFIFGLAASSS